MIRSIRLVHDNSADEADQRAERRSGKPNDALKLARVRAELSHLDHLEARRETDVANLKRLKEAFDALRSEVEGKSTLRRF